MRRSWQRIMIACARSEPLKRWAQSTRTASQLARQYVAGATAAEGVERAVSLAGRNIRSSLFYLGEYVDSLELVEENVAAKLRIIEYLSSAGLDIHVSVDPTQIGFGIDPALARDNAFRIGHAIKQAPAAAGTVSCLMLDMEDASVTDFTIALHDELKAAGLPAGLTLQSYLKRTQADMERQIRAGAMVRLVRGAFAADSDIAFTGDAAIKANYRALIDRMLSAEAKEAGMYPVFGTHDEHLHSYASKVAQDNGWLPGSYEFEMLLGVRSDVAARLAADDQRIRLYVPFGRDWWPHAMRRIGENPRNAILLARSLGRGQTRARPS